MINPSWNSWGAPNNKVFPLAGWCRNSYKLQWGQWDPINTKCWNIFLVKMGGGRVWRVLKPTSAEVPLQYPQTVRSSTQISTGTPSALPDGLLPAIMSSTALIFSSTCSMSPTSVLVCKLRTLFRRTAVNMLQTSAWQVTSQCSSSSVMQVMLSASWMMKFISRSNSPPTSWTGAETHKRINKVGALTTIH